MDAEQLADTGDVAGLLAHFAPDGILRILTRLEPAAGHRPGEAAPLCPTREQHPAVIIGDNGVRSDPQIHGDTLSGVTPSAGRVSAGHGIQRRLKARNGAVDVGELIESEQPQPEGREPGRLVALQRHARCHLQALLLESGT